MPTLVLQNNVLDQLYLFSSMLESYVVFLASTIMSHWSLELQYKTFGSKLLQIETVLFAVALFAARKDELEHPPSSVLYLLNKYLQSNVKDCREKKFLHHCLCGGSL